MLAKLRSAKEAKEYNVSSAVSTATAGVIAVDQTSLAQMQTEAKEVMGGWGGWGRLWQVEDIRNAALAHGGNHPSLADAPNCNNSFW